MAVMGNQQGCWILLAVAALSFVACDAASVSDPSATVTPAFLWSDSRLFGAKERSVNYESHTSESLGNAIFEGFGRSSAAEESGAKDEKMPELILAFIGQELQAVDVSRTHSSASTDVLDVIQTSMAGAKYSLSIPYVTVGSDETSVAESFLSTVQKKLGSDVKMGDAVVAGSCSVQKHGIKNLAGVHDIEAYLKERKSTRAQGETDVLVVCYSPTLDVSIAGVSMSEGKALSDVLSVLKSSGTSNAAMYTSDPVVEREGRHRVLARQLIANYSGSATPECDALCRSRAVILEGIFVAITLITILVSGICCMKAVTSPLRFEAAKES